MQHCLFHIHVFSLIFSFIYVVGVGLWIGLNDLNDQMSFSWADGTPVRATYWMHSEPNNWLGKNEDCVEAISYKEVSLSLSQNRVFSRFFDVFFLS